MTKYAVMLLAQLLLSPPARAADINSVLRSCSTDTSTHVEERECLTTDASESSAALKSAEAAFLGHLSTLDQQPADRERAKAALAQSEKAFEEYREKQCEFFAVMAMGGNGASDLRFACVTALNNEQSEQLKWAAHNWQ
jgi:uncharacterized protein YecT (DUF1311 family)